MFLLDTHTLLWWLTNDKRISAAARHAISEPRTQVFVSAVSVWEIAIKRSLGKLTIPDTFIEVLEKEGFIELAVSSNHAWTVGTLPPIHADPFDRLLIAQAMVEGLTIITGDPVIPQYRIPCLRI